MVMEADKSQGLQANQQAGDPGELRVSFQAESKGPRTKRADMLVPVQKLA